MVDMNVTIANNIVNKLKENGKKQVDLADALGVSKQTVSKMLSGTRIINAVELSRIADFCNVSMEELVAFPQNVPDSNAVRAFMGKVGSASAKQALEIVDELADLVVFHAGVRENAELMMKPWRM
ncbi:MAG: helix-turn-helix domain-containing protein [Lachnospiraceae bacterium]|nr:helix-turn-helix domain-containing protein [Lachnospiraceae bacterium]